MRQTKEQKRIAQARANKQALLDWDTSSLEGMERTARNEEDQNCSTKINGVWFEVICEPLTEGIDRYKYKWGKNFLSDRKSAQKIFSMKGKA